MTGRPTNPLRKANSTATEIHRHNSQTDLLNENSRLRQKVQQLNADNENLRESTSLEIKRLNELINDHNRQDLTESHDKYYFKGRMMSAGFKIEYLKDDLEMLQGNLDTATNEKSSAILEVEQLRSSQKICLEQLGNMKMDLEILQKNLEAVTKERDSADLEVDKLRDSQQTHSERLENMRTDMNRESKIFQRQINKLERENNDNLAEAAVKEDRWLIERGELAKERNDLKGETRKLQLQIKELRRKIFEEKRKIAMKESSWLTEKERILKEKKKLADKYSQQKLEFKRKRDSADAKHMEDLKVEMSDKSNNYFRSVFVLVFIIIFSVCFTFSSMIKTKNC